MPSPLPVVALLAGGLATRLGPLTQNVPKSLVKLAGEPFLAHQLRLLVKQGICEVVICCGHLGEKIEEFAGDGWHLGCCIRYSYDGDKLLGTGGALRRALPLLGESFLVMYGDSYLLADPVHAWNAFLADDKPALMTVFKNEGRWDASNVEMIAGTIVYYGKEKRAPGMQYIDYGLSVLHADVLARWKGDAAFDLSVVLASLASEGKLAAHEVHERFYEIGSPAGLKETECMLTESQRETSGRLLAVAGREK